MKVTSNDPRWISINRAHQHGMKRIDNIQLVLIDLERALANGTLSCIAKDLTTGAPTPLIAAATWIEQLRLDFMSGKARVIHRKPLFQFKNQYVLNPVRDRAFFVWQPALDLIWPPPIEESEDPNEEPLAPRERAKVVLRHLYRTKAQMPDLLKTAVDAVNDECSTRKWKPLSRDTIRLAAKEIGFRPRKTI